jgi:hypothetical protein
LVLVVVGTCLSTIGRGVPVVAAPGAPGIVAPTVTPEAMLAETAALAQTLANVRRAPSVRVDWERRLVTAAEARAQAEAIVRGAFAPGDAQVDEQLFRRLGLLADGLGYLDLLAGAIAREPTGFYDPVTRRLSVPDFIPLTEQRSTLAHEIAHALQDQRVGLRRFLKMTADGRRGLSFDALLARQALIEGDAAVLAMEALDSTATFPAPWELAELAQRTREGAATAFDRGATNPAALALAPPVVVPPPMLAPPPTPAFLREVLAFPYSEGFAFVAAARGLAPWSAIDAMWARPPDSTAQILHPWKYEKREATPSPTSMSTSTSTSTLPLPSWPLLSSASGEALQLARTDTLGELLVRIWLAAAGPGGAGAVVPPEIAERAATGWRGDRIAIYLPAAPDKTGVVQREARGGALAWITAWDSDADAEDFLQTASLRLAILASGGSAPGEIGEPRVSGVTEREATRVVVWRSRGGADTVFAIARRATLVALLLGVPEAALPSLTAMLDAWTPQRAATPRHARPARGTPSPTRSP